MVQLQEDIDKLKEANINLVCISYDSVETLKEFSDRNDIEYLMLSDPDSATIDAFGIRNKAMDGKSFGPNDLTGIPHPGTYVLDDNGVVTAKLFLERYQVRHSTDELVKAVQGD